MRLAFWIRVFAALFAFSAIPVVAWGAWAVRPDAGQVLRFLERADSVLVWSIALPDTEDAKDLHGVDVLGAAAVRSKVAVPKKWGREFAKTLLEGAARPDTARHCFCDLVLDADDTADIVIPVVQLWEQGEPVWIPVTFRDGGAQVFLFQGNGPCVPLENRAAALMRMIHEVLPGDSAFANGLPPARKNVARTAAVEELPETIHQVKPSYPESARSRGLAGTVLVQALVGEDGTVKDGFVTWSLFDLDEPSLTAVKQWRFKPARSNGKPVAVWVVVPVKYTLR